MDEAIQRRPLSAADIRSAADIQTKWIDVPEWGGEGAGFWARQMTQGQTMRQLNELTRYPDDGPCLIVIFSAVEGPEPDSPYLFSMAIEPGADPKDAVPTDLKALRLKSMAVLDRVQRELVAFNKRKDAAEIKKT